MKRIIAAMLAMFVPAAVLGATVNLGAPAGNVVILDPLLFAANINLGAPASNVVIIDPATGGAASIGQLSSNNVWTGTNTFGSGDYFAFSGTPLTPDMLGVIKGTAAAPYDPNGPLVEFSRTINIQTGTCASAFEICNATLTVGATVNSASLKGGGALYLGCQSKGGASNGACYLVSGKASVGQASVAAASAGLLEVHNSSSNFLGGSNLGQIKGLEIDDYIDVAGSCTQLNGIDPGLCPGNLWLTAHGNNDGTVRANAAAIQISESSADLGAFQDGIVFTQTSNPLDTILNNTIVDYTNSPVSLHVKGSHATASIDLDASVGPILLSNNNVTMSGTITGGTYVGPATSSLTTPRFAPVSTDLKAGVGADTGGDVSIIADNAGTATELIRVTGTGTTLNGIPTAPTAAVDTNTTQLATTAYVVGQGYAKLASPTFTGTVTHPTPFTLGAVSVTTTGTQLNYLSAATGTTGTTSTNVVFSTSPTIASPTFSGTVAGANTIPLSILAQIGTNSVLGNFGIGTGNVTAQNIGSCSASGSALIWTTSVGFGCFTTFAILGANTFTGTQTFADATAISSGSGLVLGHAAALGNNNVTGGNNIVANTAGGYQLTGGSTSGTAPDIIPNHASTTTGIGATSSGTLTLIGSATDVAEVTSGGFFFKTITTGTAADDLCMVSGGLAEIQASTCTISDKNEKNLWGKFKGDALYALNHMTVWDFSFKKPNADPNGNTPTVGLTAQGVAQWASACSIYYTTKKGKFILDKFRHKKPKSYKPECLIGVLVKAVQQQQVEIAALQRRH